jgi:hypothetical protein
LAFYEERERQGRVFESSADDKTLAEALEVLRGCAEAPLMAELPAEAAFTLWSRAGSFSGALGLAGLDPLDDEGRREAAMRYAIARATPDMLPQDIRARLKPAALDMLSLICDTARRLGRFPRSDELPKEYWKSLRTRSLNVRDCLRPLGLTLADALKKERPLSKREQRGKGSVAGRKQKNAYWLTGKKYKALSGSKRDDRKPEND